MNFDPDYIDLDAPPVRRPRWRRVALRLYLFTSAPCVLFTIGAAGRHFHLF